MSWRRVLAALTMVLWSLPIGAEPQSAEAPGAETEITLPLAPTLENLETGVRSQVIDLRQAVEGLVADETASTRVVGTAVGQLGSLYLLYDFIEPAEDCLVTARRLDPENFFWPYFLGALYTLVGQPDRAEEALIGALEVKPGDLPTLIRLGNIYLELGDVDAAESSFQAALEVDPEGSAARFGIGRVAFDRGEYEAAISHLEAAMPGQPEGSVGHYFLGMALRHQGDLEGAREHLRLNKHEPVAFRDEPIDRLQTANVSRETFFNLGVEAMRRGEPERALEAFEKTLETEPNDAVSHYNVGMVLLELGKREEAEEHVRRATELDPDYRNAHFNLAVLLSQRGEHQEAARHFQRAAEIDPDDPRAQVRWAEALARLGEEERAIQMLERVLEIDPALVLARLSLATLQADVGQLDAAEENLRKILALAPGAVEERSKAHYRLATFYPDRPRAEVIEHLQSAVELNPDFGEAHQALAGELAREGDYAGASHSFARVIELEPGNLHAHFGQAMALMLGGFYPQARDELERSLALTPDDMVLTHALARLLATCPDPEVRDGERAVELSLRLVENELTVDHAETLAMAYAEVGRFEDAIRWQSKVVDEGPITEPTATGKRQKRLELYQRHQPVRAPWLDG